MTRTLMTRTLILLSCVAAFCSAALNAQQLGAQAFAELAGRCAPAAPLPTIRSIVATESAFNPFALSINYPEAAGLQLGIGDGTVTLARQPRNAEEAIRWARWFLSNQQTVSVGLMQLNVEHLAALKISLEQSFDPCTNLKYGWLIFSDKYAQASAVLGKGQLALHAALSAYNSGSLVGGFRNGYVDSILRNQMQERITVIEPPHGESSEPPPPADNTKQKSDKMLQTDQPPAIEPMPNPRTTQTKVGWDMIRATAPWVAPRKD